MPVPLEVGNCCYRGLIMFWEVAIFISLVVCSDLDAEEIATSYV